MDDKDKEIDIENLAKAMGLLILYPVVMGVGFFVYLKIIGFVIDIDLAESILKFLGA